MKNLVTIINGFGKLANAVKPKPNRSFTIMQLRFSYNYILLNRQFIGFSRHRLLITWMRTCSKLLNNHYTTMIIYMEI